MTFNNGQRSVPGWFINFWYKTKEDDNRVVIGVDLIHCIEEREVHYHHEKKSVSDELESERESNRKIKSL